MPEVSYQKLVEIILPSLPDNWTRLVLYVSFMEDTCDLKYYVRDNQNRYADCFQLNIKYDALLTIMAQIHKEVSVVREQLTDHDRWKMMTLCVEADGNFHVDYKYSDESVSPEEYNEEWRQRYLN